MNQVRHTLQKFPGNMQNMQKAMRGAVAVEFALVLIPLLMLALGAAEFGRAMYQYNTLVKAARDSVRYLSHYNPSSTNYTQAQTEAKCFAVYGNSECTGQTLAPGLATSMVNINPINTTTAEGTPITLVEVKITGYIFNFILDPRTFLGGGEGSITFDDITATMRQS
ncbi:TadE/TadG family type IV pilus assembly protein [Nitrosomonas communis]|uniref:TadE/TadG family type IV pilus assembly protein n=1 Tax=Nitrosomonas communis TaxID=44574 RepID=UPI003D2BEBC7